MTKNISTVVVLFLVLSIVGTRHKRQAYLYGPPPEHQRYVSYTDEFLIESLRTLLPPTSGTISPCTTHCTFVVRVSSRSSKAKGHQLQLPSKRGPPFHIFNQKSNCSVGAVLFFLCSTTNFLSLQYSRVTPVAIYYWVIPLERRG